MENLKKNPLSLQLNVEDFAPASNDEKKSLVVMRESVNFWKDGMRRLRKNKIAMVSLVVILLIAFMAYVLPSFWPYSYEQQIKGSNNLAPFEYSAAEQKLIDQGENVFPHILGTDRMGRDFAVRVMMGTRVSLSVGLLASVLVLLIGATYGANLEEAKQLLADAGYPNGEGFPTIEYSTNDAGYHTPVAEYVQQAWGELGITVNINKVEWASFTPMRRAGDYDVSRNGWVMDYNDPSNMIELFTTTNGNNDGKYSNPEFDAAVEASKVADKSVHFQKLHEAEDILMEDAACIPVAYYNDFWLQSPSLKGTWHSPYGYWYLQYGYIEE